MGSFFYWLYAVGYKLPVEYPEIGRAGTCRIDRSP